MTRGDLRGARRGPKYYKQALPQLTRAFPELNACFILKQYVLGSHLRSATKWSRKSSVGVWGPKGLPEGPRAASRRAMGTHCSPKGPPKDTPGEPLRTRSSGRATDQNHWVLL